MKDLTEVMQKLGMTQAWMKESAKAVLQDSSKKQRAQEYLQKGLLFEVGRLIHDAPVSSNNCNPGGKGAGKGKGKQKQIGQTTRTPWSNLTPRPDSIFVDALANPVPIVPLSKVHSAATGVFLAGASEFESFLGITSNAPLAMLAPQTPKISATLQARQLKYSERMIALYDSNTGISTPKPCFLIQLGSSGFTVAFAETKPDVTFAAPDPVVEVTVDVEIGQVDALMQQEIDKNPRFAFKQIVQAAFSEHVVREAYAVHSRLSTLHGLVKVPAAQLANVLKRSGPDGIFTKEKWRTGAPSLPLALIHHSHLREKDWDKAIRVASRLAGFSGIHRSSTGSKSLRFSADGIANARTTLCLPDLYTSDNVAVVAKAFYQVQGLPSGMTATAVATGLRDWGWVTIPVKSWPLGASNCVWLVGTADEPPGEFLCLHDTTVTIVKDGARPPSAPTVVSVEAEDPLQISDPWARFKRNQMTSVSPSLQPPTPKASPPAPPKVQAVVESRIVDAETRLTAHVDGLMQALRQEFSQQINATRAECNNATVSEQVPSIRQAFDQECEKSRAAQTVVEQQLKETAAYVKKLESGFVEQVQELKQQQKGMEERLIEAISASAKASPARKAPRS